MFRKYWQRLRLQAFAVLFGIVLISTCTVSAGAIVTDVSGDGMYLYNGVMLPDVYDLSTDHSQYPYAVITSETLFGSTVYFSYFSNVPLYFNTGTIGSSGLRTKGGVSFNCQGFVIAPDEAAAVIVANALGVSSFPVNEWVLFYSFSENLENGVSIVLNYSNIIVWSSYDLQGFYYADSTTHDWTYSGTYLSASTPIPSGGNPDAPPDDGGSSSIDFSATSLTVSHPSYDFQSAVFDISWSNLPVIPYPDNIQYFIQGRLNDGASSHPPVIYLGSSSDPPIADVPITFSFSSLQPETEYTATFELVYNYTSNFRDFTRSGVTSTVSFTTLSDGSISEGDKAIINAIQQGNKDNQEWTDSQFGSAVGDLPEDTTETDSLISGLDQQEEAYKDDAYDRFQELSSSFSGFDGSIGSGIGLAGTLFSRFFNALGSYKIVYTFPLLLGLAMVLIGRLGRSSIRIEREPGDQFTIDGW